jgi:hypothetical protein
LQTCACAIYTHYIWIAMFLWISKRVQCYSLLTFYSLVHSLIWRRFCKKKPNHSIVTAHVFVVFLFNIHCKHFIFKPSEQSVWVLQAWKAWLLLTAKGNFPFKCIFNWTIANSVVFCFVLFLTLSPPKSQLCDS